MGRVRKKGLERLPPPVYHPQSTALTLAIYYGGKAVLNAYEGGKVRKLDYVDLGKLNFDQIGEYLQDLVSCDNVSRFYTAVPGEGGFKLLLSNNELQKYGKQYIKNGREYPILLDTILPEASEDVGGEGPKETEEKEVSNAVEDNLNVDNEIEHDVAGGEKLVDRGVRESSVEFLSRAEPTKEWLDEYTRRYPGVNGQSFVNNPKCADVIDDFSDSGVEGSDESDTNFSEGHEVSPSDDDMLFDSNVVDDVEPAFVVEKDLLVDDVVFMNFDVGYESENDSDFVPNVDYDSSMDNTDFDDNVSDSAEVGVNFNEDDNESEEQSFFMEDVVGKEKDDLDMRRVSDDEAQSDMFPPFNMVNIYDPTFYIGQTFVDKNTFKKAVQSYALKIRRSLHCIKSCAERVYARCRNKACSFKLNAIRYPDEENLFVLREMNLEHVCDESYTVKNVKTQWLAERYIAQFKSDPKRNVLGWRIDIRKALSVDISVAQAYRAKRKAIETLEGDPDYQYTKLWDYANELRKTNPGSTIVLGTDDTGGELRFSNFYACFQAMKSGFKSCRPIVGVDGCHLKGPHGGVLLTAVGVDPNNSIFPLSYAVVSAENKENWCWFFHLIKNDLEMGNGSGFTFISNKQKGLIHALPEVFPAAEVRFCVRHLILNLNTAGHKGFDLKNAVYKAANATTVGEFRTAMSKMRAKHPGAFEWFKDNHPSQWSKSHFLDICKCDMILNNSCESFNSSILPAREKPILTMLEWIREYLMKLLQKCREEFEKWEGILCPRIADIIVQNGKKVGGCWPIKASRYHYQVQTMDGCQYAVNLDEKTCLCREWQLTGIPCTHALSAIYNEKQDALEMVDEYYRLATFREAYQGVIFPISGHDVWGKTMFIPPLPPNFGRKPGRPKKLRRRGIDEKEGNSKNKKKASSTKKLRRFQTKIHCGHCDGEGHNALFCPELPESAQRIKDNLFEKSRQSEAGPSTVQDVREEEATVTSEEMLEEATHILPPHPQTQQESIDIDESQILEGPTFNYNDEPSAVGPTMFDQLQMGNTQVGNSRQGRSMKRTLTSVGELRETLVNQLNKKKSKGKKETGVKLRVPPNMNASDFTLSQASVCGPMHDENIILDGGKKFLTLSSPSKFAVP